MKLLGSSDKIKKALKAVAPKRIAVAYVGKNWDKYVELNKLEEVIVSPTLGSNPYAIDEIEKKIGWDKVHFLDKLHSKIYLGEKEFIIGSANLSNNALFSDDTGLFESVIRGSDQKIREELSHLLDTYVKNAKRLYPDQKSKEDKLQALKEVWKKMPKEADPNNLAERKAPNLKEYEIGSERIIIVWWENLCPNYDIAKIEEEIGGKFSEYEKEHSNSFCEDDIIDLHDWVINWQCKRNGDCTKVLKIDLFRVDQIVQNGVKGFDGKETEYTKLAFAEAPFKHPPFLLDKRTKEAFRKTIESGNFEDFTSRTKGSWKIPSKERTSEFLQAWQQNLRG